MQAHSFNHGRSINPTGEPGDAFDFKRDRISLSLAPAGGGALPVWDEVVHPRSTLAARHLDAADVEVSTTNLCLAREQLN